MLFVALALALSPIQARQQPVGSMVFVEGYVTVPSGAFESFIRDRGFVIGDERAGIYVTTQDAGLREAGSAVEVRGVLADEHGLLVLRATEIRTGKGRHVVQPRRISLSEVDEEHEGNWCGCRGWWRVHR